MAHFQERRSLWRRTKHYFNVFSKRRGQFVSGVIRLYRKSGVTSIYEYSNFNFFYFYCQEGLHAIGKCSAAIENIIDQNYRLLLKIF